MGLAPEASLPVFWMCLSPARLYRCHACLGRFESTLQRPSATLPSGLAKAGFVSAIWRPTDKNRKPRLERGPRLAVVEVQAESMPCWNEGARKSNALITMKAERMQLLPMATFSRSLSLRSGKPQGNSRERMTPARSRAIEKGRQGGAIIPPRTRRFAMSNLILDKTRGSVRS